MVKKDANRETVLGDTVTLQPRRNNKIFTKENNSMQH